MKKQTKVIRKEKEETKKEREIRKNKEFHATGIINLLNEVLAGKK